MNIGKINTNTKNIADLVLTTMHIGGNIENTKILVFEVTEMRDVRLVIGEKIKDKGFSQAAIARKAGMTPQQLCDVVNLRRRLDANEMLDICDAMGIPYSDLRKE